MLYVFPVVIICVEPTDSLSYIHFLLLSVKTTFANAVIFSNAQDKCAIVVVRCVIKAVYLSMPFCIAVSTVMSQKQDQNRQR